MKDKINIITIVSGILDNNSYIVFVDKSNAIIIDPPVDFVELAKAIKKNELTITTILLTHGHYDHVGIAELLQKNGAKVYICKDDEAKLTQKLISQQPIFNIEIDGYLQEGEVNFGGITVRVLHTPGHTSGSVCFLINDSLFTGDTLFSGDIGRTDLPTGCYDTLKKSINKLFKLNSEIKVLPGHDETTTIGKAIEEVVL